MQVAGDKDPEANATCPYNPAHRLPLFRMKRHLVKCRRSYPNEIIVPCPLNITHRVPTAELAYHIERCPDRVDMDRKFQIPEVIDNINPIQQLDLKPPTDECWDNESNPTYDPTKHVMDKPILRILNCESKAKRRDFRIQERSRISRINEQRNHASSTPAHAQANEPMAASSSGACRRPNTKSAAIIDIDKRNLDPYKVNDMLHVLDQDQKKLLDSLKAMSNEETVHIFPIGQPAEADTNIYSDNEFPALECTAGPSRNGHVSRGACAAKFQNGRGNRRK